MHPMHHGLRWIPTGRVAECNEQTAGHIALAQEDRTVLRASPSIECPAECCSSVEGAIVNPAERPGVCYLPGGRNLAATAPPAFIASTI